MQTDAITCQHIRGKWTALLRARATAYVFSKWLGVNGGARARKCTAVQHSFIPGRNGNHLLRAKAEGDENNNKKNGGGGGGGERGSQHNEFFSGYHVGMTQLGAVQTKTASSTPVNDSSMYSINAARAVYILYGDEEFVLQCVFVSGRAFRKR